MLLLAMLEELTEDEEWKLLPTPDLEESGGDIDLLMANKSVRRID